MFVLLGEHSPKPGGILAAHLRLHHWGRMWSRDKIRRSWPGELFGFDNGAFSCWRSGRPFEELGFRQQVIPVDMLAGVVYTSDLPLHFERIYLMTKTYFFDCYHRDSLHRLRKVYTVHAERLEDAVRALPPEVVPFQVAAETTTRHSRFVRLDGDLLRQCVRSTAE